MLRRRVSIPVPRLSADTRAQLVAPIPGDEARKTLWEIVKCAHCGGMHEIACPRVRKMRFRPLAGGASALVEIEFWPDGQWSREGIIWPSDVFVDGAMVQPPQPELPSIPSNTQAEGGL